MCGELSGEATNAIFFTAKVPEVEREYRLISYTSISHLGVDDFSFANPASTDALIVFVPDLLRIVSHQGIRVLSK
jgi:hypothetical protein